MSLLSAAFDGLKVKDNGNGGSDGSDVNNGGENGNGSGNGSSSGNGSGNGSSNGNGNGNGGKANATAGSVKTGDQANVAVPVTLAIGAVAVMLYIARRRKRA